MRRAKKFFSNGMNVSNEQAVYLEESTHLQAQSVLWFKQRAGHITASMFRKVTRTSVDKPSRFLVKSLMQESKFDSMKVPALNWGLTNEEVACEDYLDEG